jgi:hypothetical protein
MLEQDPIGNDARERRRRGRLGPDAVCALCGERNLDVLHRTGRALLERHHLAGEANDPDATVVVCQNCHAKLSSDQLRFAAQLMHDADRSMPEKLVEVLRGLALFFEHLARSCEVWAQRLAALVAELDEEFVGWRTLPGARG